MTDNATEYLERKMKQMDESDKHFRDVMQKRTYAESNRPKTPAPSRVTVRQSTTDDAADAAAAELANYNDRSK